VQARYSRDVARLHALSAAWSAAIANGTADPEEVAKFDRWEEEDRSNG
jgi:ferric-dicitrate binding protein FerR (iron transport regulator)